MLQFCSHWTSMGAFGPVGSRAQIPAPERKFVLFYLLLLSCASAVGEDGFLWVRRVLFFFFAHHHHQLHRSVNTSFDRIIAFIFLNLVAHRSPPCYNGHAHNIHPSYASPAARSAPRGNRLGEPDGRQLCRLDLTKRNRRLPVRPEHWSITESTRLAYFTSYVFYKRRPLSEDPCTYYKSGIQVGLEESGIYRAFFLDNRDIS